MKKLDLSGNFSIDLLSKTEASSRTPQKLVNLNSRGNNENMAAGLVINSFRDARDRILKHKAYKNITEGSRQNQTLNESANKVNRLEAEWNNQKNSCSQTRPSHNTSQNVTLKKHVEASYDIKPRDQNDTFRKNESKYGPSYFKDIDSKFEDELGNKSPVLNKKSGSLVPSLSLKSAKKTTQKIGNMPQTSIPKVLKIEDDTSISKQKLHILGRILQKASIPNTTRPSSAQEDILVPKTPKLETNNNKLKDMSGNFSKSQMGEKPHYDDLYSAKAVSTYQVQSKVMKNNSYFDRRASEDTLISSLKHREHREKKNKKTNLNNKKTAISPISIKVNLLNNRDLNGKENKPSMEDFYTPKTATASRVLNITPTSKTRVKSPLQETMKSIERSINMEETKPKAIKIEPKRIGLSQNIESKNKPTLELSKILRPETPQIKSVRVHFPEETNNDGTPLTEKSGFYSQRELKKEVFNHKDIFKKIIRPSAKAEMAQLNERDKLYQHIIQRLNQEKA